MEKTALIQQFRTRIGEDDAKVISDKTFDSIADTVLPLFADDSKITDETWLLPVNMLKQYAGQKRHDEAEFSQKYKTDYAAQHETDVLKRIEDEKKKALEEFKKLHPEIKDDNGGGNGGNGDGKDIDKMIDEKLKSFFSEDSEFGKLSKGFSDFLKSQQAREKTEVRNTVKAGLIDYLTGLEKEARKGSDIPVEIKNLIEDAATYIDYGDEPKLEDLKATVKAKYESEYKRRYPNGGQPFGGSSSGGDDGNQQTKGIIQKKIDELKKTVQDNQNYAAEMEKGFC